jgi:hypothetical protein
MVNKETKVKFWKDNNLDQEHEKTIEEMVDDFIGSEMERLYLQGMDFEPIFANHLAFRYGSFDTLTVAHWIKIKSVYDKKTSK